MNIFRTLLVAATALAASYSAVHAARLTSPIGKQMLHYTVSADQSGGQVNVGATVGPLYMAEDGFGLRRGVTKVSTAGVLGVVPVIPYADGQTQKQVQDRANAFFKEYYPIIRNSIQDWMRGNGVSHAWVTYKQSVNVTSTTGVDPMNVQWSAFIDSTGRGIAPNPKVVTAGGLKILQVRYLSYATSDDVPSALGYADAGKLYWRVLNDSFIPLTGWSELQTNGAFDEPYDPGDETPIDPDAGLKCLMDKSKAGPAWQPASALDSMTTCNQTMPDVISLMDESNSQLAIVDYVRQVAPIWCREDDAACLAGTAMPAADLPDDPDAEFIALVTYRFDSRTLGSNACGTQEFRNHGWSGYKLDLTTDRYVAFSTGAYQAVNQFRGTWISDAQEFDNLVVLPVDQTQDAVTMADKVINPKQNTEIVTTAQVPNIVELAPVVTLVDLGGTYDVLAQGSCSDGGWSGGAFSYILRCHPGGQIGLSTFNNDSYGTLIAQSPEVLFTRGHADSGTITASLVSVSSYWWWWWTGSTTPRNWAYDGANKLSFPGSYAPDWWYTKYTTCSATLP